MRKYFTGREWSEPLKARETCVVTIAAWPPSSSQACPFVFGCNMLPLLASGVVSLRASEMLPLINPSENQLGAERDQSINTVCSQIVDDGWIILDRITNLTQFVDILVMPVKIDLERDMLMIQNILYSISLGRSLDEIYYSFTHFEADRAL